MLNKIDKIIVIADPLRRKNGDDGNASMFYGLLYGIIKRISNIQVELLSPEKLIEIQKVCYAQYGFDITKNSEKSTIFGGVPPLLWEKLCFAEPTFNILSLVENYFKNSLVVCREPSFILKKSFNMLGIPYIEIAIHSVRYLDDLILAFTSNIDAVYEKFKKYEIDKELFYFHADLIRAEANRKWNSFNNSLEDSCAIYFAQTPIDRSLLDWENKKMVSFFDYEEKFIRLTEEYKRIYYKPHPHYVDNNVLKYIKKFPNVQTLNFKISTYDLLSLSKIKKCVAISSGTINEAHYFGKETEYFLYPPYEYSEEIENKALLNKDKHFITVHKDYFSSSFWADVLSPIIETHNVGNVDVSYYSNKMRRIIGTAWGYNDNDSQYVAEEINKINNQVQIYRYPKIFYNLYNYYKKNKSSLRRFLIEHKLYKPKN